jgi:hypothetical protein
MVSHKHISVLALGVFVVAGIYFYAPYKESTQNVQADDTFKDGAKIKLPDSGIPVTHIKTPESVKSLYMTAWVAGTQSMRDHVIDLLNTTETNAVVIDIKDATGRVAFTIENEPFKSLGSPDNRIPDIRDLLVQLVNLLAPTYT